MPETRLDQHLDAAGTDTAEHPDHGRRPFIAPSVEDLGGLAELTLLGGSL